METFDGHNGGRKGRDMADSVRRYARGAFDGTLNLVRRLANRERYFLHAGFQVA